VPRVKGGPRARRRHNVVRNFTKGQVGGKHRLWKRAHEAMAKSLWYVYRDRRDRKRDFRRLWIARINAASRLNGLSYNRFVYGLKQADVELDRKILADLAVTDGATFARLVEVAKSQ
jgi:large subunit ribosomal protein L20